MGGQRPAWGLVFSENINVDINNLGSRGQHSEWASRFSIFDVWCRLMFTVVYWRWPELENCLFAQYFYKQASFYIWKSIRNPCHCFTSFGIFHLLLTWMSENDNRPGSFLESVKGQQTKSQVGLYVSFMCLHHCLLCADSVERFLSKVRVVTSSVHSLCLVWAKPISSVCLSIMRWTLKAIGWGGFTNQRSAVGPSMIVQSVMLDRVMI